MAEGLAPTWRVFGVTTTGAKHVARGQPPEDAFGVRPSTALQRPEPAVAVAISDGHGHSRHFRSGRGAELAVEIATALAVEAVDEARGIRDAAAVGRLWRGKAGSELVNSWRAAVEKDVMNRPITAEERAAGALTEDATFDQIIYAYGATLIVVAAAGPWLLSAQIGDGDLFAISHSGAVASLVPSDPRLDGTRTTSLCQLDAVASIRFGVATLTGSSTAAVMMATDGFGNAQAGRDWRDDFGHDVAGMAAAHGDAWVGAQLPQWAAHCASSEGSADDVTVALMFAGGGSWRAAFDVPADSGEARFPASTVRSARLAMAYAAGFIGAAIVALGVLVYELAR